MDGFLDFVLLQPHPAAPPDAVGSVNCSVLWRSVEEWAFDFCVSEPCEALRLPDPQAPARADDLWQTTCLELFLQREGEESYLEFNFSPSGLWAAYQFGGYRRERKNLEMDPPLIQGPNGQQCHLAMKARFERWGMAADAIQAILGLEAAPSTMATANLRALFDGAAFATGGPWRAGLSAVIEEANGTKSYWALAHPSDKPDFHHPESFVLELP